MAADFGASNGRITVAEFDGRKIKLSEIHRFENIAVYLGDTFYWDFLKLFHELKTGLVKASKTYNIIESIGVETWGCDFGLLDKDRKLLSNPVHYRDKRTLGLSEEVRKILPDWEMYKLTQAQIIEINTIYQLFALKKNNSAILENSKYLLFLGDLFNYFLTGQIICEYSNATITQLYSQKDKKWVKEVINRLGLPGHLFSDTTDPGTIIGKLCRQITNETGCPPAAVALPGYDTTSEITAIPVSAKDRAGNWAYLNCGTWGMVGIISNLPVVTEEGMAQGFGNEGGFGNCYHFLKNMVCLWIIQQCRKKWNEEKKRIINWKEIDELTESTKSRDIFIDVDDQVFEREIFDMPGCIMKYCKEKKQGMPENIGQISRVFYESLALKYLLNLKKLEKIIGKKIELLHMVGGGSNISLLCQWISDATGLPLIAGPAETTTTGNILAQMVAVEAVSNIEQARQVMIESVKLWYYTPEKTMQQFWDERFLKYLKILALSV